MAMISKKAKQPMEQKASYGKVSDIAGGGTSRPSFTGSSDPRTQKAGMTGQTKMLKEAKGVIDQGPETMDISAKYGEQYVSGGPKAHGSAGGMVSVAKENVTAGMGGKVIKDMK
tara:strand:- start:114 stop:455 length:342 start_codon:yes stop_codon:yes gene_type:complete